MKKLVTLTFILSLEGEERKGVLPSRRLEEGSPIKGEARRETLPSGERKSPLSRGESHFTLTLVLYPCEGESPFVLSLPAG